MWPNLRIYRSKLEQMLSWIAANILDHSLLRTCSARHTGPDKLAGCHTLLLQDQAGCLLAKPKVAAPQGVGRLPEAPSFLPNARLQLASGRWAFR